MIRFLIRHDPLRYSAAGIWLIGILYGVVIGRAGNEDFALGYGPHTQPADKTFLEYTIVQTIMFSIVTLASLQAWRVASPFQRSLPLDARDLFWSRMIVTLGGLLGASLLACLCFTLTWARPLYPLQIALAINAHGLLVLIPVLFHSARVKRAQGVPWFLYAPLLFGLVWLGVQLGMRTWWPGAFWLGLAVALGVSIQLRLPRAYVLAGAAPRPFAGGWARFEDSLTRLPLLGRGVRLDRCLRPPRAFTRGQLLIVLSLSALLGALMLSRSAWGGLLGLVLIQLAWFSRCVNGSGRVAHLPIARGTLFAHAAGPGLVLVLFGVVADLAGWFDPDPTWPALLALWALTWWQLLALNVTPALQLARQRPARLVACLAFLLLVTGVSLVDAQRAWVAAHVAELPAALLWPAAALAWAGAVLLLRSAFLRADCAPSPPEALS